MAVNVLLPLEAGCCADNILIAPAMLFGTWFIIPITVQSY